MPDVPKLAWIVVEHMAARGGNPLCTTSLSIKKRWESQGLTVHEYVLRPESHKKAE